jgi:vacuolar-type H+-ATPase subunit H
VSDDDPFVDDVFEQERFAGAFDDHEQGVAPGAEKLDVEGLLQRAIDTVSSARAMPLSASVLVARDELLDMLQGALDRLPEEVRHARWLLRERDEFLATRQREADDLLEDVRAQAERMVQRTEIVRQANQVAQRILDDARDEARRLRHEAEDYCDQRLASFEIVLDRTLKTVAAGRQKLRAMPGSTPEPPRHAAVADAPPSEDSTFFDQDET